jgi:hypothetical protein
VVILLFLFRFRIAVLALLALATAGAAFFAFHGHPVPVGALFLSAGSLLIGAILAFVHVRHTGLAVLIALAPLPGLLAAGSFAVQSGLSYSGLLAVYGFAYLMSSTLGGDIARRILDAAAPVDAAREALARVLLPAVLCLGAGAALIASWLFRDGRVLGFGAAAELVAAGVSVLVFVPLASAVLPFGELFFVAANRVRERRESVLRIAANVVEPRWAMSLSGAALVMATLGWFGAAPHLAHSALLSQPALWGASALLAFLIAFATGRDWRDALAASLALATLALLCLFLWGRATGRLTVSSFVEMAAVMAAALFLMLQLIARSRAYRVTSDNAAVARLRALEDLGLAPWFGIVGAGAVTLPWIVLHGSIGMLSAMLLLAAAAALLAMPALSTALESVVRRRRSVDELYGRG